MQILKLLADYQTAGSTKCLANVAKGPNDCNDHVWVVPPVVAGSSESVLWNFREPMGRCTQGAWSSAVRWCRCSTISWCRCWLVSAS
uniref:Uncharacterized protein n=1 Tax=Arundo donax TaxID=35708 RepID=A0A0A9HQF7_ARUDO